MRVVRTLIIPDIHNKVRQVDAILARLERNGRFDRVVCLGDYFDDFGDTVEEAQFTARWLKARIEENKFTLLLGNHDVHYLSHNPDLRSSGYSDEKAVVIDRILTAAHWQACRLHVWVDDWLLSHAGWNAAFGEWRGSDSRASLDKRIEGALQTLHRGELDPLLLAGWVRGGDQEHGGILWQDKSEAQPLPGLRQIVGHTPVLEVETREHAGGVIKYCDTRLGFFGVLAEGRFEAIETGLSRRVPKTAV